MGYSKQYAIENERMILSFEEQEHFAKFSKIKPSENTLIETDDNLPRWLKDTLNDAKIRNELQGSIQEANDEMRMYKRFKRMEEIENSGLTANNLNLPFQKMSGNNIKK